MKLNDPFGRMEKRNQIAYEAIRDSMRRGGIDTPQAARDVIGRTRKRSMTFLATGLAISLPLILLVPKAIPAVIGLLLLMAVWVVTWTIKGKRYIERYIKEDLQEGKKDQQLPPQ